MKVELNEGELLYIRYHMSTLSAEDHVRLKVPEVSVLFKAAQNDGTLMKRLQAACVECATAKQRSAASNNRIWDAVREMSRG